MQLSAHRLLVREGICQGCAVKAFIATRIGDALLLIGLILLYVRSEPSSLRFSELFTEHNLDQLAHSLVELPLFGEVHWISLIGVLIFCAPSVRVPSSRCTSGCRMRWRGRHRSAR